MTVYRMRPVTPPPARPAGPAWRLRRLAPDDPRHGTLYGYSYWHCRQECCRAAKRDYDRRRAELVRAEVEAARRARDAPPATPPVRPRPDDPDPHRHDRPTGAHQPHKPRGHRGRPLECPMTCQWCGKRHTGTCPEGKAAAAIRAAAARIEPDPDLETARVDAAILAQREALDPAPDPEPEPAPEPGPWP